MVWIGTDWNCLWPFLFKSERQKAEEAVPISALLKQNLEVRCNNAHEWLGVFIQKMRNLKTRLQDGLL